MDTLISELARRGPGEGRQQRRRGALAAVIVGIVVGVGSVAAAAETEEQTLAAVLGKSVESDYVAKHFTLVFGGVVLNQFKTSTKDNSTGGKDLFLDNGSTDAKAFLEGGFRWRWAWLDRDSALTYTMRDPSLASYRAKVSAAIEVRKAAKQGLDAAKAQQAAEAVAAATQGGTADEEGGTAAEPPPRNPLAPAVAADTTSTAIADAARVLAEAQVGEAAAKATLKAKARQMVARRAKTAQADASATGPRRYFSLPSRYKEQGGFSLLPDDWTTRMGFVFDGSSKDADVVSTVGSSDLYTELGLGWNLVRWTFDTVSDEEAPVRGAINLEMDAMFFTDDNVNDVHGRGIGGLALVFGVPMTFTTPDPRDELAPTAVANEPVVEFVTRVGVVGAEVPQFLNGTSNQLKEEHGNAKYGTEWGFGMDVEINVPITQKLGYLVARGQINAGFDPNPWFISLGYTIPLSTLASAITSGG